MLDSWWSWIQSEWNGFITPADIKGITSSSVKIILILIVSKIVLKFSQVVIERLLHGRSMRGLKFDEKRIYTMSALLKSLVRYAVYFISGVMILGELGVNTASIIASAGIVGLAIGFGAQNLVRDVLSGFFILFEDQYAVGDYVSAAGATGTVEEIGLRVSKIREWTGQLHVIPNGEINKVVNYSRGNMAVLFEVGIAYEADLDRAIEVINETGRQLAAESPGAVTDAPKVLGVVNFGESDIALQVFGETVSGQQWAVGREMRRRIKLAFDQDGIEIPYPRRVLFMREEDEEPNRFFGTETGGGD